MNNLIRILRDPAPVIDPPAAVIPPATPPAADPASPSVPSADPAPKSVSATVDINTPPKTPETPPPAGTFTVPDAFKDKPYMKGIDSLEKLYAMLDGAQTLIGSKGPQIPKADAPQAEKDAYYDAIGRPKTAAEYKIPGAEKADPGFLPKVQAAMHKAGLSQAQAQELWGDVQVGLQDWMKEKNLVEKQQDVDFTKLANDTFGVNRDRVLTRGKELINGHISPSMRPAVEKLDNNALVVLADILHNIDKKYIKPDGIPPANPNLNNGTPDELRGKARELMEKQAKLDPMSAEFQNYQKQINDIYDNIRRGQR